MPWEISGEITTERMKWRRESKNNMQLCMWLVDGSKVQCCKEHFSYELGMLGPWIKANSVQSYVMSDSWRPHGLQRTRSPCPSLNPGVYSNSCPLSRYCHPTITSSVTPFSSHLQSFPASGSFQMSQFFALGDQSIGVSASVSVFPMKNKVWFSFGWTGWISLQPKGLSRVSSNTTVQKHQFFFSIQLSL